MIFVVDVCIGCFPEVFFWPNVGNPVEGEHDSGLKLNAIPL
jgi:hypothetical protein